VFFASEIVIITSIFQTNNFWLGAAFSILLAVVFAGIAYTMF
jgi:hypothetical protein